MRSRRLAILILLLLALPLAACNMGGSSTEAEQAVDETLVLEQESVVSATGEVRPARWANLSFPLGGTVNNVQAEEGEQVAADQPLMDLETVQTERAVAEAGAALAAAEAALAQVKAGAHPQDVAAAEQAVAAARANESVAQAQGVAAEAELGRAQASVSTARAQVAIAQAGVKIAEAELSLAQSGARPEDLASAQAALTKARAAVRLAQADYDRSDKAGDSPQALALEQATLDLKMVQSDYDRLVAGPRQTDVAPARAGVEAAKAQVALAEAQADQAGTAIAQAQAAVTQAQAAEEAARAGTAQAQAALDRLRAGPTSEEVGVAEAAVAQAQEALTTAQTLRDRAILTAPYDGTVGLIYVRQGEEVMPGQTVLVMGDLSDLRVETTDLDEIDVARIEPGQKVDLTFDALPDKVLPGRVAHVATLSTPGQTATTYKVIIELEETDPALRWGMTAFVDILVQ